VGCRCYVAECLLGLANTAGNLAHRVVHLLHGATDPCGLVALLADGKLGVMLGLLVLAGHAAERVGRMNYLTEHAAHLVGQGIDADGKLAKLVVAQQRYALAHVSLAQCLEGGEDMVQRLADGAHQMPEH